MQPYDDSLVLDRLLGQMDLAFTNITGQTISFIDHRGRWHGPLRLERFTDFCRCVMDSPEGAARCRACNHTMGLRSGGGGAVECCHMGVSVISMPVPVAEQRELYLSYGQFLTQDTQAEFYRLLEQNCTELGLDYDRLRQAAGELRVLSREELDARVQLLRFFAAYLAVAESELRTRMEYAEQMEKKLELERKLHSMEFKFLQSQISPHFLFNTLNLLMRTAYRENAPQTAGLICDLSELLRRAYRSKDSVCTLAEELLCAEKYLTLQCQRMGPEFSYSISCQPGGERIMIPVLTIQPLVENAIVHGLVDEERPLRLEIDVKADSKLLRITVSDNGEGIPRQVLRQLEGAEGEGSGLRNVSDRLKLFFGPEARLDISSRPGEGTRVELLCPLGAEGGEAGV